MDKANFTISQFLTLSSHKAADRILNDLNQVVADILPHITQRAKHNEVRGSVDMGDLPPIYLDRDEIGQLIWNLALNGIEAMSGGGDLTIKTVTSRNGVHLIVADTGPGINPGLLPDLGTPFVTDKPGGTGLWGWLYVTV